MRARIAVRGETCPTPKCTTKDRDELDKKPQAVVPKISTSQDLEKTEFLEKSARFLLTTSEMDLLCGKKWERVVSSRTK
jgi:hypothetical protein